MPQEDLDNLSFGFFRLKMGDLLGKFCIFVLGNSRLLFRSNEFTKIFLTISPIFNAKKPKTQVKKGMRILTTMAKTARFLARVVIAS